MTTPSALETEAFKEALAAVKSRDGDWRIGDHEILDEIARGGMGVIYRAREPHSGRIVALKCILAYQGDSDQALARFRREAETAARLDHPNIVPIYHVGETADGSPFFTMKYAQTEVCCRRAVRFARNLVKASCSWRRSRRLFNTLTNKAFSIAISNREISCWMAGANRSSAISVWPGVRRLRAISPDRSRVSERPATSRRNRPTGPPPSSRPRLISTVWARFSLSFLTGRPPFLGDNALGVMKQSAEKPAPKLRTLAPHLDRDLETICARCLERDPSARVIDPREVWRRTLRTGW